MTLRSRSQSNTKGCRLNGCELPDCVVKERTSVIRTTLSCLAVALAACAGNTVSTTSPDTNRPYAPNPALESRAITTRSNPILASGADYTTDPAPFVAGGTLYILTGRDTARAGINDFMMPE